MPRGGSRRGAGRRKGSKNKPQLQLVAEHVGVDRKPTAAERMQAQRRQVALLAADNMPHVSIAAVMRIPLDHLEAVFSHELQHGLALTRAEALFGLRSAGDAGSVSAERALEQLTASQRAASEEVLKRFLSGQFDRVDPMEIYGGNDRDQICRKVVSFWAGLGILPAEIGKRLGRNAGQVITQYPRELADGPAKWSDPDRVLNLFYRAKGGDADAAALWLFATAFDQPLITAVLQAP